MIAIPISREDIRRLLRTAVVATIAFGALGLSLQVLVVSGPLGTGLPDFWTTANVVLTLDQRARTAGMRTRRPHRLFLDAHGRAVRKFPRWASCATGREGGVVCCRARRQKAHCDVDWITLEPQNRVTVGGRVRSALHPCRKRDLSRSRPAWIGARPDQADGTYGSVSSFRRAVRRIDAATILLFTTFGIRRCDDRVRYARGAGSNWLPRTRALSRFRATNSFGSGYRSWSSALGRHRRAPRNQRRVRAPGRGSCCLPDCRVG